MELPDTNIRDIFNKPPHYLDIAKKFGQLDLKNHTSPDGLTAEDIRLMKKAYYAKMTLIDRKIGEVLDTLKKRGMYEDTLILFTSDHGEYMGDFGVATKAQYCFGGADESPVPAQAACCGF